RTARFYGRVSLSLSLSLSLGPRVPGVVQETIDSRAGDIGTMSRGLTCAVPVDRQRLSLGTTKRHPGDKIGHHHLCPVALVVFLHAAALGPPALLKLRLPGIAGLFGHHRVIQAPVAALHPATQCAGPHIVPFLVDPSSPGVAGLLG